MTPLQPKMVFTNAEHAVAFFPRLARAANQGLGLFLANFDVATGSLRKENSGQARWRSGLIFCSLAEWPDPCSRLNRGTAALCQSDATNGRVKAADPHDFAETTISFKWPFLPMENVGDGGRRSEVGMERPEK